MSAFFKISIIIFFLFVLYQIEIRSNVFTKMWASAAKRKSNIVPQGMILPDYPFLLDASSDSNFKITDIDSYGIGDTDAPYSVSDYTVLRFITEELDLEYTLLDKNGGVVCKIIPRHSLEAMGDFLAYVDGYYVLAADDCGQMQKYEDYNALAASRQETITEETLKKLYDQSEYFLQYDDSYFEDDSENSKLERKRYIFFREGSWLKIDFAPSVGYLGKKFKFGAAFIEEKIQGYDDEIKTMEFMGGRVNITLDYFEKTNYAKARKAGFMNPSGTSASAFWYGTGYYTLKFDGQIMKFKLDRVKSWGNLRVLGKDDLNFLVLKKIVPGNYSSSYYIIRLKP